MNENDKYCNNCGIKGHLYKDCHNPIMSFGHILFGRDNNKILMIQRKDSLCYIDFIRGKYDIYNIPYIQILFDKCTVNEKHNILKESYETLWKRLWLTDTLEDVQYNDYMKGHDKFIRLKKGFLYNKTHKEPRKLSRQTILMSGEYDPLMVSFMNWKLEVCGSLELQQLPDR